MGGWRGEVKVVSIETRGQPDAGWLAATKCIKYMLQNIAGLLVLEYQIDFEG